MAGTATPGVRGVPADEVTAAAPPPGSRSRRRHPVIWAGLVVGTAVALVLVAPAFGPRPPAGEDVMAHLVRADFAIPELVARGRLDGWFPRFVLGHQEFLFNGPGLVWLMALARGLTAGVLSNPGALKVIVVGSFVGVVPAAWFLARSFGLSSPAAGLGAALAPCVSNYFGLGLQGLFDVGLISHQVGAILFCLALGAGLRVLDDGRLRWRVLVAGALAGLAVTHLISALVLAVMLALCLLVLAPARGLSWAGLRRLAGAGAAASGLAGFWLLPLAAHRDLRGIVTTWGTPPLGERLSEIARGDVLLPVGLGAVAAVAAVFLVVQRQRPALALGIVPAAYLVLAHASLHWPGRNEVTLQLANRGLGYVGLLAVLGVGALGAAVTARLGTRGHLGTLAAAAVLALTAGPGLKTAGQMDEPVPAMRTAAAALARMVPDGARFATQRDYPSEIGRTGMVHPETWLARQSGRNSLNGFNLESSSTPRAAFAADDLDELGPRTSARRMARLGVTHVVATGDVLADDLTASGRFRAVWRQAPLTILEVIPPPGQPTPASLVSSDRPLFARLTDPRAEHLAFALEGTARSRVTVALAWSPKWHARLNNRSVELDRTTDGLATVDVGPGSHTLRLDYRSDAWDHLGLALTVLTLLGGSTALKVRRARRHYPMSSSFSRTA